MYFIVSLGLLPLSRPLDLSQSRSVTVTSEDETFYSCSYQGICLCPSLSHLKTELWESCVPYN